jgi:alkylation response protein AidB-like acyl-CoA dehydrogenase
MAEASGLIEKAINDTAAYLKSRVQFGRPLSTFQVLQHRCVDMYVMMVESKATARAAASAVASQTVTQDERRKAVAAAKVTAGRAAVHVSREIIQLHGGMGMSDEMPIGDMAKRLMTLESAFGNADHYLGRFADLVSTAGDQQPF